MCLCVRRGWVVRTDWISKGFCVWVECVALEISIAASVSFWRIAKFIPSSIPLLPLLVSYTCSGVLMWVLAISPISWMDTIPTVDIRLFRYIFIYFSAWLSDWCCRGCYSSGGSISQVRWHCALCGWVWRVRKPIESCRRRVASWKVKANKYIIEWYVWECLATEMMNR